MKNKKYGKITAMLMAAAVLVLTAVPVYAAENIREVVKNQEMVLEAGTDRVTYRVDTESGTAGSEAVAVPASKETGISVEAAGQETQAADTAETGESTETEKEAEVHHDGDGFLGRHPQLSASGRNGTRTDRHGEGLYHAEYPRRSWGG